MLRDIIGLKTAHPTWSTVVMALIVSSLLVGLRHQHGEVVQLMSHLLVIGAVLIVWTALGDAAASKDRLTRLKHGVSAGLSEAVVLAAAGSVFQAEVVDAKYALPLGWICAMVVLVDRVIEAHARHTTDGAWILRRVSMLRGLLLVLGIACHWLEQRVGTLGNAMGIALTSILGFSVFGCIWRYRVAASINPAQMVDAGPELEVKP